MVIFSLNFQQLNFHFNQGILAAQYHTDAAIALQKLCTKDADEIDI